jgi:hypothetical protein
MPLQIIIACDDAADSQSPSHRLLAFNAALFPCRGTVLPLDQIDKAAGQCVPLKSAPNLRRAWPSSRSWRRLY